MKRIGYAARGSAIYSFMTAAYTIAFLRVFDGLRLLPFIVLLSVSLIGSLSAEWLRRRLRSAVWLQVWAVMVYGVGLLAFPLGTLVVGPKLPPSAGLLFGAGWIIIAAYLAYQVDQRRRRLQAARPENEASGRIDRARKCWNTGIPLKVGDSKRSSRGASPWDTLPLIVIGAVLLGQFLVSQTNGLSVGLSALFEVGFLAVSGLPVMELSVLWELLALEREYGYRLQACGS